MTLYAPSTSNPLWSYEERTDDEETRVLDISLNIVEIEAERQTARENLENYTSLLLMVQSLMADITRRVQLHQSLVSLLDKDMIEENKGFDGRYMYRAKRTE